MTINSVTLGLKVAEARMRRGITQSDLANAISLDRTAIAKIENGLRKLSAMELAAIAEEVGERVEWFIRDAPQSIVSHRESLAPEALNSTIDAELERLARNVEFVTSFDDEIRIPEPVILERPTTAEEAESLAVKARALLGADQTQEVRDLVGRASRIGLLVFSIDLGTETADAGTILLERGAVSLINSSNKVGRRRLALAHELGHFLIADEYTIDWRVATHGASQTLENLLDRFARALLLPAAALADYWTVTFRDEGIRIASLRAASHFRVDMATLARRVVELGLVSAEDATAIRQVKTTRSDIIELDLLVPHDLEGLSLPRAYEQSVLRVFRRGKIGPERAIQLLSDTVEEAALPQVPIRSESEIWKFTS